LKEYKYIKYYVNDIKKKKLPLVILAYEDNAVHYQQLIYKSNTIKKFEIPDKIKKNILKEPAHKKYTNINELCKIESFNISKKTTNNISYDNLSPELKNEIENIIIKYKNLSIKSDENIDEEVIFKKKINEGFNYPPYPNHPKGKFLLIYIRNYLMKRKNKINKNLYPDYILNSKKNIENEKRYFRNIANNYELDKFNNLSFKFYTEHIDKAKNKKNTNS
jgi:hypothetical protein